MYIEQAARGDGYNYNISKAGDRYMDGEGLEGYGTNTDPWILSGFLN